MGLLLHSDKTYCAQTISAPPRFGERKREREREPLLKLLEGVAQDLPNAMPCEVPTLQFADMGISGPVSKEFLQSLDKAMTEVGSPLGSLDRNSKCSGIDHQTNSRGLQLLKV